MSVNTRDRRDTCRGKVARAPREREGTPKRKREPRAPRARTRATPETHDPSTSARMSMLSRGSRARDSAGRPPDPTPPHAQPLLPLPSLDPATPPSMYAQQAQTNKQLRPAPSEQRVDPPSRVRSLSLSGPLSQMWVVVKKLQTLNETPNTHNAHTHINTHIKHAHTHGTH